MRLARLSCWLVLCVSVAACGTGPGAGDRAEPDAPAVERGRPGAAVEDAKVVATIGGHRVTAGEVRALAREAGLSPREALDRLIGEALLAKEAERRGYGRRAEVAAGARRAAVQALLAAQVERALPESAITEQELAAAYEAQRARFARPEERTAIHVLFPLAADASAARAAAAQRLAEAVVSELRADGPDAVLARYAANPLAASDAFRVVAETVPGLTRGGAFDPAFLDAVFALQAPGVVPGPVRTSFGWHAIALTSIRPDATLPLDRARVVLRQELLAARRGALLGSLVEGLASRTPPLVDGQLAARLASVPADEIAPSPSGAP